MDHKLIESLEKTNAAMKDAIVEITTLRARIAELEAERGKVADGYVIVPVEPTREMRLASSRYKRNNKIVTGPGYYRAIIAAAPSPTVKE